MTALTVRRVSEQLFDRFGVPKAIQSDNGQPFASSTGLAGLTKLSAWSSIVIAAAVSPAKSAVSPTSKCGVGFVDFEGATRRTKGPESLLIRGPIELRGGRDSKTSWGPDLGESERIDEHSISHLAAASEFDDSRADGSCTIAPSAAWEAIAAALARAEEDWLNCSEPRKLRRALHDILRTLDD